MQITLDIETTVRLLRIFVAAWLLLSSFEWLQNRDLFRSGELLSWEILRLRSRLTLSIPAKLGGISSMTVLLVTRCLVALPLALTDSPLVALCAAVFALILNAALQVRATLGADGSDQMGQVLTCGTILSLLALCFGDKDAAWFGVVAIGLQSTMAYFVAGYVKIISEEWRSGRAIFGVMATQTYGHSGALALLERNKPLAKFVCATVTYTELAFPLIFFLPPVMVVGLLACYGGFHIVNAVFMGLNNFVVPFIGAYPAVLATVLLSHRLVAGA